jgi:hypothetical protein
MQLFTNREVAPPHELAREGKLEELKATIENYGLTLKEVDENRRTMLHAAAETEVMRYLIDSGIDRTQRTGRGTLLSTSPSSTTRARLSVSCSSPRQMIQYSTKTRMPLFISFFALKTRT